MGAILAVDRARRTLTPLRGQSSFIGRVVRVKMGNFGITEMKFGVEITDISKR